MKKRLLSLAMTVQLFLTLVLPVMAVEINDSLVSITEERMLLINDLISLAGKAAREGDYEKAEAYEKELIAMGVEIVVADTYEDACAAFVALDENVATPATIEKPEDTPSVHWYRCEYLRYYYPQKYKYFDAITLRAVSWDDTSDWLHVDKLSHTDPSTYVNTGYVPMATAAATYVFGAFASLGANAIGLGVSYTMLDFLSAIAGEADSNVIELALDSYFCHYVADISYIFTYVKESDTDDYYRLTGVEAIVDAEYQVHFTERVKYADGHVDSYPGSEVSVSSTTTSNGGISFYRIFDAYEQGVQYIGHIGAIHVELGGEDCYITYINMPESPATPFSQQDEEVVK